MRRHLIPAAVIALVASACGGGAGSSSSTTVATTTSAASTTSGATTTSAAVTTSTAAATTSTEASGGALVLNADGSYSIDWDGLVGGVSFAAPVAGAADPFFNVHNDPAADGFFFSIEAYTVYGAAWSGELGDFEVGCFPAGSGICVHFDPDGPGPLGNLGADFMATGDVTIVQADGDGFVAIVSNLEFSDGTTIPGPFTITG